MIYGQPEFGTAWRPNNKFRSKQFGQDSSFDTFYYQACGSYSFTTLDAPTDKLTDCAIAVDVLSHHHNGNSPGGWAEAVKFFSDLDQLMHVSDSWPVSDGYAGERGKVAGKLEAWAILPRCTPEQVQGRRLFIQHHEWYSLAWQVQDARIVLAAALINRKAVVDYMYLAYETSMDWFWLGRQLSWRIACAGAIAQHLKQINSPLDESSWQRWNMIAAMLYRQIIRIVAPAQSR